MRSWPSWFRRRSAKPVSWVQIPGSSLIKNTMKLHVKRIAKKPTYTIGRLYIDDKYFCDALEDTDRGLTQNMPLNVIKSKKIPGQTAIPTGTYKVIVNISPKFKRMLPRLLNVPGFDGILIHRGNSDKDSSGCLLCGENKVVGKVINSTGYELKLTKILQEAQNRKESIEITIE